MNQQNTEREIRLFDLFISVLQRWRSLLICLIIGAVVLGAYGWWKSASTATGTGVSWESILTVSERTEVEQLYATMLECDGLIEEAASVTNAERRLQITSDLANIQSEISATKKNFTDDEKAYLNSLMGNTGIIPGNKDTYTQSGSQQSQTVSVGRHINLKYVVIGALLGLILAAIIIIIKYVVNAAIKSAAEVKNTLGMQLLGRFDGTNTFYEKRKTGLDRWLRKVKQSRKQKIVREEAVQVAATQIRLAAEKKGFGQVCMAVDFNVNAASKAENGVLDAIIKAAAPAAVTMVQNPLGKADDMQTLADADGAVLVLQTEQTRFPDVLSMGSLCKEYGTEIIGAIVVE